MTTDDSEEVYLPRTGDRLATTPPRVDHETSRMEPMVLVLADPAFALRLVLAAAADDPTDDPMSVPLDLTSMLPDLIALGLASPDDTPGAFESTMREALDENASLGRLSIEGPAPLVLRGAVPSAGDPVEVLGLDDWMSAVATAVMRRVREGLVEAGHDPGLDLLGE